MRYSRTVGDYITRECAFASDFIAGTASVYVLVDERRMRELHAANPSLVIGSAFKHRQACFQSLLLPNCTQQSVSVRVPYRPSSLNHSENAAHSSSSSCRVSAQALHIIGLFEYQTHAAHVHILIERYVTMIPRSRSSTRNTRHKQTT